MDRIYRPRRCVPPVLRELPDAFAARIYTQPALAASVCNTIARGCIRHSLDLPPTDATELGETVRVLPPNHATLLTFKSLLLHLPYLIRRSGYLNRQFVAARYVELVVSLRRFFVCVCVCANP